MNILFDFDPTSVLVQNGKGINSGYFKWHPFSSEFYVCILSELKKVGISYHLYQGTSVEDLIKLLKDIQFDGVITNRRSKDVKKLEQLSLILKEIPTVSCFSGLNAKHLNFVSLDNPVAMELVVSHLKHQGYRHIGFVATGTALSQGSMTSKLRYLAWKQAMEERGLPVSVQRNLWVNDEKYFWKGDQLKKFFQNMKRSPALELDALVCSNDQIAFHVIEQARLSDIRVPEELGVTGVDGLVREEGKPKLTTVTFKMNHLAASTVKLLLQQIQSHSPQVGQKMIITPSLVHGETSLRRDLRKNSIGNTHESLQLMKEFLLKHLNHDDPVTLLAKTLGIGKIQTLRNFKKGSGVTCHFWLQNERLSRAKELLIKSSQSIQAIAAESGFTTMRTFNRWFLLQLGSSPQEWRSTYFHNLKKTH